jgi:hypothetical protein
MCGITPQLLLGVAGYTDRGWAIIAELAEFLQEGHDAIVGLWSCAPRNTLSSARWQAIAIGVS